MNGDLRLQDPQETLDHSLDWSDFLGTDTIATSTWSVSPTGPTLSNAANTTTTATVFMSGVSLRAIYALSNKIVTTAGRTAERSLTIRGFSE